MKRNLLVYVCLAFLVLSVSSFYACNKNSDDRSCAPDNTVFTTVANMNTITLAYIDESGAQVNIDYDQLQTFYRNIGILDTPNNTITDATIISGIDADGNEIMGVKTKWTTADGVYHYNIASEVYKRIGTDGVVYYVLGTSEGSTTTWNCSCKGNCNSGCNITGDNPRFCDCSACFPSGNCEKKHERITTPSKYM